MLLSFCIPAYNCDFAHLKDAVDSIYKIFEKYLLEGKAEIILSFDYDGDNKKLYEGYVKKIDAPNLKVFYQSENRGMVGNWNFCVGESSGRYILVLGQDDVLRGTLDDYVNLIQCVEDNGCVAASLRRVFIDEAGKVFRRKLGLTDREFVFRGRDTILPRGSGVFACLSCGNLLGEPLCFMFRRDVFYDVGEYRNDFKHAADLDLNLRFSLEGDIYISREICNGRRIHPGNLTKRNAASGVLGRERWKIRESYKNSLNLFQRWTSLVYIFLNSLKDYMGSLRAGKYRFSVGKGKVQWLFRCFAAFCALPFYFVSVFLMKYYLLRSVNGGR